MSTVKLDVLDHIPPGLETLRLAEVQSVFPNPALLTLSGLREQPLFLSLLLHGNETTSFDVLKYIAQTYAKEPLPRTLLVFIGNVSAAAHNVRHLARQPDYNRIWAQGTTPEHDIVRQVLTIARSARPFASIDVHNNTGTNPIYGCVNALRPEDLFVARRFAPNGVYYQNPSTTQSIAFSHFCPAITLECGQNGDAAGLTAVIDLIEQIMRLDAFPDSGPEPETLRLFETVGRVLIDPDCSFGFGSEPGELQFPPNIEALNFDQVECGHLLARTTRTRLPIRVVDAHEHDITDQFLTLQDGHVLTTRALTPSMITKNVTNIRQDCLCYFMQRLEL